VRTPVSGSPGVDGNDLVGDRDDAGVEEVDLLRVERVADHDEAVTVEQLHGPLDLGRVEDLEVGDAVVGREVLALRVNLGGIAVASGPSDVGVAG
jgi:hypothetical protein